VVFAPTLTTGAATQAYSWRLGVAFNEAWQAVGLVPDAPVGVLSGLGVAGVNEWVTAPTLTNDTDKVTLGAMAYVHDGIALSILSGDVALDQDDGDAVALAAAQEYVAVLSVGAAVTVTTTKGSLDTAGTAVAPAYPAGELPLAVVRVPFGGVIVTSTLLAVSGRCLVSDAGGLNVTVQPGRCSLPGYFVTPAVVQTLTLADDATSTVYMSEAGVANVAGDGIPLAVVICASGDISSVTDARVLLSSYDPDLYTNDFEPASDDTISLGTVASQFQHAFIKRALLGGATKTLTNETPTAFATLPLDDGDVLGGEVIYTVTATSGTSRQIRSGRVRYSAARDGATYDGDAVEVGAQVASVTTGTLTGAISVAAASDLLTFSANFDSSLGTPTVTIDYRFDSPGTAVPTPL
jgi:hypothetical protein